MIDLCTSAQNFFFQPSLNSESIESLSFVAPSHRVNKFTGLEEIGQSTKKEAKKPYISARAELLGKRANQQTNEPTIRKGWSAAKPLTGNLMEQRSELFRKRNPQRDQFWDGDSDSQKSDHDSTNSTPISNDIENGRSNSLASSENSDHNLVSKVFSEPEVCIIDPSKSRLKLIDQSDEEIDLC